MKYLSGTEKELAPLLEALGRQKVDMLFAAPDGWQPDKYETTLKSAFSIDGPGTYSKGRKTTLTFAPCKNGWFFNRQDQPEQLPVRVSPANVWTAQRSIVLRSGAASNYMRMTEHIIACHLGLGLDNVVVGSSNGDPPLYDVGSMPIVEAIGQAGIVRDESHPLKYFTVKEDVVLLGPHGSFLRFEPAKSGERRLSLDVAIDFPNAIGKQRIQFDLTPQSFTHGAHARTNCSRWEIFLVRTIGKLLADFRNLGYTNQNILIAGKRQYYNKPTMIHDGKSLEAVWHRACLDLVAALSLFDKGRLAGHVTSYKAGHSLDCRFMTLLEINDLWQEMPSI